MGPRLVSRGDSVRVAALNARIAASMGPRLVSRGDRRQRPHRIVPIRFNGAAACEPRRQLVRAK